MPTATQHRNRPSRPYPRKLGRFINLGGGLYGSLDVVARDPHHLELQTGEDFIWFDREQAKNLRDTIDRFLAFHVHSRAAEEVEHLEERIRARGARGRAQRAARGGGGTGGGRAREASPTEDAMMRSNVALAVLSIVGTFAMMAGSRRRTGGGGAGKPEPLPVPSGVDTTTCRWVPPASVPPVIAKRAAELQQITNSQGIGAGWETVEVMGDEVWKFKRAMHPPNDQNPKWHLGIEAARCVRQAEGTTTGGEPDAHGCLWVVPSSIPPDVGARADELLALRAPLWSAWIEELGGETWKFRYEPHGPSAHPRITVLQCARSPERTPGGAEAPTESTEGEVAQSGQADALLEAALASLGELGAKAAIAPGARDEKLHPLPSCSCAHQGP